MNPIISQIAKEYKSALQYIYREELAALVLFGSYARGDYHNESDIDFALVLNKMSTDTNDIFKTSEVSSNLEIKYGYAISTLPVSTLKLQESIQGVYQEIRREGIII